VQRRLDHRRVGTCQRIVSTYTGAGGSDPQTIGATVKSLPEQLRDLADLRDLKFDAAAIGTAAGNAWKAAERRYAETGTSAHHRPRAQGRLVDTGAPTIALAGGKIRARYT
jgi:hypothetical protein